MIKNADSEYIFINSTKNFKNICYTDKQRFVVLTFNFEVKKLAESMELRNYYVDKIASPEKMSQLNKPLSEFLSSWYKDHNGGDLFKYKEINFGRAFLLTIWSEIVFKTRIIANIEALGLSNTSKVRIEANMTEVIKVLRVKNISFDVIDIESPKEETQLFFDIHRYMSNALQEKGIKTRIRSKILKISLLVKIMRNQINLSRKSRGIFLQVYHPTIPIIETLRKNRSITVFTNSVLGKPGLLKYFQSQNVFNIRKFKRIHQIASNKIIENFRKQRVENFVNEFSSMVPMPMYLLECIIEKIRHESAIAVASIDAAEHFFRKNKISLYVSIANLGTFETVLDEYCRIKNIPRFMIINGYLSNDHYIDSRDADFINCYSESIKQNFYRNSDIALALGDPRMDEYSRKRAGISKKLKAESEDWVIGIGTAGYNNTDLLSYVAFEFEFISEIMSSIFEFNCKNDRKIRIKLKIRSNGVKTQYEYFLRTYFPDLTVEIIGASNFSNFVGEVDLYISTYSQTLFEAATLGKPVIYFKKDIEELGAPFDGKSELVTARDAQELFGYISRVLNMKMDDFAKIDVATIEKYFGFLDGNNKDRNVDFIYKLMQRGEDEKMD